MTPEATPIARSAADYAIGFANQLTISITPGFTDTERREALIRAFRCLALLSPDAVQLRSLFPSEDQEGRGRVRGLKADMQEVRHG